jgi:DNA polymerase-1
MVKIIDTSQLSPEDLTASEREACYNGLDCCVTAEVLEALLPQLNEQTSATYEFSKSLQGPVLHMGLTGILVDQFRKTDVIDNYYEIIERLDGYITSLAETAGLPYLNWRSYKDLQKLFYDRYQVMPILSKTGQPTLNRAALEKIESYYITLTLPMIYLIKKIRELQKRIDVLRTEIDHDGRMRTSYNIAGTTTGRFSSSLSEFGTGGNLQNIEEHLRSIFIADPGMKLANFDAEQGESRVVGAIEWNLFGDSTYLDACESGDLHTAVARICWPDLGWKGTLEIDRALAEEPYYRHYSRRFMCKKLGHGANYGGRAQTLSAETKTELPIVEEFCRNYHSAFPAHRLWHHWVESQLAKTGKLTSLTGRLRHFFGRRDDHKVIREAIAYDAQGSLVDIVNRGMLKVWNSQCCQLLLQGHDSIIVQYHEEEEDELIPKILSLLHIPISLANQRTLMIPYGCKTGWNWGEYGGTNPDGLKKYAPGDKRRRTPPVHILDRKVR